MLNDLLLGSATAALQKPLLESRLGAAVILTLTLTLTLTLPLTLTPILTLTLT